MEFTPVTVTSATPKQRRNIRTSDTEQLHYVKLWQSSQLRPSAFCRQHGLNIKTFLNWRKRHCGTIEKASLPQAKPSSSATSSCHLKVTFPNGAVMEVTDQPDGVILKCIQEISQCKCN